MILDPNGNSTNIFQIAVQLIDKAIKAVPAVKYFLAVVGLIAAVSLIGALSFYNWRVAFIGGIVVLFGAVIVVVFANLARQQSSAFRRPAQALTWMTIILFGAVAVCLFSSVFFGKPLDLRRWIDTQIGARGQDDKPVDVGVTANSDGALRLEAIKANGSLVDIFVRNMGTDPAVIHKAQFIVTKSKAYPDDNRYSRLPSTHQYNVLLSPWDEQFGAELAQEIAPNSVDRFQIVLALGRMVTDENKEGPWGYSLIFPPKFPNSDKSVAYADMTLFLQLTYNNDQVLKTSEFTMTLYPIGYGYRAKKIAGFTVEEKISLLSDNDINVVESVVDVLGNLGDENTLAALQSLNAKNLDYLKDYYAREIYEKQHSDSYEELPPPEERLSDFRRTLTYKIKRLQSQGNQEER